VTKPVEVKEFQSIIYDKMFANEGDYKCIEKKQFDALAMFIREYTAGDGNADVYDFMRLSRKRHVDAITFRNYVGLIQLENGFQVQVLPKIDFTENDDVGNGKTKRVFFKMLRSMKDFPCKMFNDASLRVDRMNLYEIFINMYIQEVRSLVKRGLKSGYISQEDNLNFFKGKLLTGQHIRLNTVHKERFYVSYDEYHQNRPENKLIKATLEKLQKITTSAENSKEIRQLLMSFEMIDSSSSFEKDFSRVVIDRNTKDYENVMRWSKVFLMNESFTPFSGNTTSRALLFPMESVYESYVASELKKIFVPDGWKVSCQDRRYYLFSNPRNQFALRPDIVIKKGVNTIILDTKWKELIRDERKNYGISSEDMYQMYAYSKKYKTPYIWLLYPINKEMRGAAPIRFKSDDNTIVNVHCVDIENISMDLDMLKNRINNEVEEEIYG